METRIQIYINGEWLDARFEDVREGDLIRAYNPDNTLYHDTDGFSTFVADGPCFLTEDGVVTIRSSQRVVSPERAA